MIELAQEKTPKAKLFQGDFSLGLVEVLKQNRYDAILATYSLHHLTQGQQISFLKELLPLLNAGGCIYIGNVAFRTRAELDACRQRADDEWDEDEIYFVYDEMKVFFLELQFELLSHCAGVLILKC